MKIILVGCGKIGTTLVERLTAEGHDIVAIDSDSAVLTEITNIYDVMGICGNGADSDVLMEADVSKAELFLAVTGSDELNMLSCFLARRLGAQNTIARIRNPEYNDKSLGFLRQELELSMSVNPEMLAAQDLFNILKFPTAMKIETFSRRHLEMVELRLKHDSVLDGLKLSELREKYRAKVLVCCIKRGDEVFIPDGNFVLRSDDRIGITASPTEIQKFLRALGLLQKQAKNVMILGGSRTARYLAEMLLGIGCNVKIVEQDEKVATELCEALPNAVIIHGDGAQQELLLEEGLRSLDAFVALTGLDELNILTSIFASGQSIPKVIAKVNRDELAAMAERMGLDTIVSPKRTVADVLVSHARALQNSLGSSVETLYKLMEGNIEALEFIAKNDPRLVNVALKDLSLKPGTLIAGIIRDRKTIIPGGLDQILSGDHVVVVAASQRLSDLADILR
ncbi:MAG: Trk system potassium transporter TrkA [Clostridia bacterium]|nr:Trk system potassium transporter TrkA [Clostridia bacterium]